MYKVIAYSANFGGLRHYTLAKMSFLEYFKLRILQRFDKTVFDVYKQPSGDVILSMIEHEELHFNV